MSDLSPVEILETVKEKITENPDGFDMEYPVYEADCGTVGCIAGWTVAIDSGAYNGEINGDELGFPDYDWYNEVLQWSTVKREARECLGIGLEYSDCLFHVRFWPTELIYQYKDAETAEERAEIACERIDLFIESNY